MNPLALTAIVSTFLKTGPDLIRTIGSVFGDDKQETANKVANLVSFASGKPNPEQALNQALSALSPQGLAQLKSLATECEVELARIAANKETTLHQQTQQTIQNGDNSSNAYVSNTRPYMARISGYVTGVYVIGLDGAAAFDYGNGASFDMSMLLISPLLAYMGLREMGKWRQGSSALMGISSGLNKLFKRDKAGS